MVTSNNSINSNYVIFRITIIQCSILNSPITMLITVYNFPSSFSSRYLPYLTKPSHSSSHSDFHKSFTKQPKDKFKGVGDNVRFQCTIQRGSKPLPQISWKHNNTRILEKKTRFHISPGSLLVKVRLSQLNYNQSARRIILVYLVHGA